MPFSTSSFVAKPVWVLHKVPSRLIKNVVGMPKIACEQVLVGFDAARLEQALNCMKQRSAV